MNAAECNTGRMRLFVLWFRFLTALCLVASGRVDVTAAPVEVQDVQVAGDDTAGEAITFAKMPVDQVRSELLQWLAASGGDPETLKAVTQRWSDDEALSRLTGEEVLDLLILSFAEVDPATKRLSEDSHGAGPLEGVVFDGIRDEPVFRNQVQLFRARWLVQHRYYDDALPLLSSLLPEDVVDPASLLFYRAVCESQLMKPRDALDSFSLLLNNTLDTPHRFRAVAEMLQHELQKNDKGPMNQVTQLMADVERRLDLGQPGTETQKQEDAVIAALDKLLEQMEQQSQNQSSDGSGNGDSQQNSGKQGANRSQIKGGSADGEADRKNLTEQGRWGMLDQKAEARARELIRKQFPSNFLDQIGRYTKKIAEQAD